ncbi:MAG: response regulator [Candidatus Goldiibacteriota bacterium]|jgi:CheY-like chemotaxis protein
MKKILIIDDSPLQQKLAGIYLSKEDYTIYTASNGKEGLSTAIDVIPDLIILDVEMPEMDGLETLRKLRSNPATSTIDVLMCSSVKTQEVIDEAVRLGARGYLNKPHGFINFSSNVKKLLAAG